MRCKRAEQLISSSFDDELDAELLQALQEHLRGCDRCEAFRARVRRSDKALGALAGVDLRVGFASRLLAELPELTDGDQRRAWRSAIRPARAVAAVLGVAVGVASALIMNEVSSDSSSNLQRGEVEAVPRTFRPVAGEFVGARYLAFVKAGKE